MDLSTLLPLKELGLPMVAVVGGGWLLWYFIKVHKAELDNSRSERQKLMSDFSAYVESNNHQKTEMIEQHTAATVKAGLAIDANTKAIEKLIDKLT